MEEIKMNNEKCKNCEHHSVQHSGACLVIGCPCKKFEAEDEFVYPAGHNWEGLTPSQVNEGYKMTSKSPENDVDIFMRNKDMMDKAVYDKEDEILAEGLGVIKEKKGSKGDLDKLYYQGVGLTEMVKDKKDSSEDAPRTIDDKGFIQVEEKKGSSEDVVASPQDMQFSDRRREKKGCGIKIDTPDGCSSCGDISFANKILLCPECSNQSPPRTETSVNPGGNQSQQKTVTELSSDTPEDENLFNSGNKNPDSSRVENVSANEGSNISSDIHRATPEDEQPKNNVKPADGTVVNSGGNSPLPDGKREGIPKVKKHAKNTERKQSPEDTFNLSEKRKKLHEMHKNVIPSAFMMLIEKQDEKLSDKLKKELTFEKINFGIVDWKFIKDKIVGNFSKCEGEEDLEREMGRIVNAFGINEIIDKIFTGKSR